MESVYLCDPALAVALSILVVVGESPDAARDWGREHTYDSRATLRGNLLWVRTAAFVRFVVSRNALVVV